MSDQHYRPHPDVEEWFRIRQKQVEVPTTACDGQTAAWIATCLCIRSSHGNGMIAHSGRLSTANISGRDMRIHMAGTPRPSRDVRFGAPGS